MSDNYAKWIGGAAGWMYGGPLGALLGYHLGKYISKKFRSKETSFEMSLLILSSIVIRVDGKIDKSELECVRLFFINSFGKSKSDTYFKVFNEIKNKPFPSIRSICMEINQQVNHKSRLQIIHFLLSIAHSDGIIVNSEINIIKKIAKYFWISEYDLNSIEAMFSKKKDIRNAYLVLGVSSKSSEEELRKAYRKMVKKYHPDKLQGVSDDIVKMANKKFQAVKDAYELIKKNRNLK